MTKRNINPKTRQVPIVRRISGNNYNQSTLEFETISWATVDDCDYDATCIFRWCLHSSGYAVTSQYPGSNIMLLHQLVFLRKHGSLPASPLDVDHADRNKLNNTRKNLREASRSLQAANTKINSNNTSGYRGVCWNARRQKWIAYHKLNGRRQYFGYFTDRHEAARAVNEFFATHRPDAPIPNPGAELDQGGS